MSQTAAGTRSDHKPVLAVNANTAHSLKQPFAHGALGIMIQRTCACALFVVWTFPAFPDGRCAQFGHRKPAGNFLILKQPVCGPDIDIRKNVKDHRRRQETCSEPPSVAFHGPDQTISGKISLFLCQKVQCKRAHQPRLSVCIQRIFFRSHQFLIGLPAAFVVLAEQRGVGFISESLRQLRHNAHDISRVRGGNLGMRRTKIRPLEHADIGRFRPFAVALSLIDKILAILLGKRDLRSENRHGFSAASDHETGIPRHTRIKGFQKSVIAKHLFKTPRIQNTDIRPANGTVHAPHVEIRAAVGHDMRQTTVSALPVINVVQIFP